MKKKFSAKWKASKQPRKQRKYVANMPLHLRDRLCSVHLSKELRKQYGFRAIVARVGDKVTVSRGQFRKKTGRIEGINRKKSKAYITGVEVLKKDGSKVLYPVHISNLLLTEMNLDDKKRLKNKAVSSSKSVQKKQNGSEKISSKTDNKNQKPDNKNTKIDNKNIK